MARRAGPATVTVEGNDKLRRSLRHMKRDAKDLDTTHERAGQLLVEAAQDRVPVVSGALFGSIRAVIDAHGADITAGDPSVPYAGPIHYGWRARNIEPQPFLTDALAASREDVAAVYASDVGKLVKRLDREAP